MRHNKKFNHLSRKAAHRGAMLSNMACSLIQHKRISTTLAKAKALRIYVEPLLTRAKEDTTANRRLVFSELKQKEVVTELFQNVAEKIANRPGGYTRILRTGFRLGDAAEMCSTACHLYQNFLRIQPDWTDVSLVEYDMRDAALEPYYWVLQWHPTPVLLPVKPHGRRCLVGCSPWGH